MLSTKSFLLMNHFLGDLLSWKVASYTSLIGTPQRTYIYYPLMFAFSHFYLLGFATIKVNHPVES